MIFAGGVRIIGMLPNIYTSVLLLPRSCSLEALPSLVLML